MCTIIPQVEALMKVGEFLDTWRGDCTKRKFAERLGISYRLLAGMYAGTKRFGASAMVGLILARANQLQNGARAWNVTLEYNPVSATTENSAKYGGVSQQVEMPLVWDDLSGGYGSWNDRAERKYHWGYGIDTRFANMVLSVPFVNIVVLGGTAPTHDIEEHDGKLWVAAGRYIKAITADSGYGVSDGYDAGGGKSVVDIEEWKGTLYAGRGFGAGEYMVKHASGDAANVWSTDDDVQRGYLWPLWDKLYGTDSPYSVKAVANDPFNKDDWTAAYTIGDSGQAITALATLEDELYIGKENGVHGLDSSGIGTQLSPELAQYRCPVNCKGMKVWHGTLIVPHLRGLLQYVSRGDGTHSVTPIGPGRGAMSDNPIRGHITAVCGDEKYLYAALWTGAYNSTIGVTYILAGCYDAQLGEWAWHPWARFADNRRCDAMFISSLWGNPHLWMGYGEDIAYIILPRGTDNPTMDANCRYALSETLHYQRHDLNAPAAYKIWKCIEIEADNLSSERYITVYTRLDNGEWQCWGNAYQSPRTVIQFGKSGIAGKTIELRLDYTLPTSEIPIAQRSVVLRAAERPDAIETITAVVRCDDRVSLRNGGRNSRTGLETWNALRAMLAHNGSVTLIDTLGNEQNVLLITPLKMNEARSEGDEAPEMLATIQMVAWNESDVNMHIADLVLGFSSIAWDIPWSIPWSMGATDANVSRLIDYAGTAITKPTIAITGQITDGVLTNATTGQSIGGFNIAAGEVYTIDCLGKTIKNKSGVVVAGVTVGDFFLTPGDNAITLTGKNISAETACRIAYRTENVIA